MTNEALVSPETAEEELCRILEVYRDSSLSSWSTYALYELDGTPEAAAQREATKAAFLHGEVRNPQLNYPVLDSDEVGEKLAQAEKTALGLMKDSVRLDYDVDRELALYDNLRISLLEVAIGQISRRLTTETLTAEERANLVDLFNIANDQVFGPIQPERFNGLLARVHKRIETILADPNVPQQIREAAEYLTTNRVYDPTVPTTVPVQVPEETLQALKELVITNNKDILACVPTKPEGETLSIDEMAEMFRQAHAVRQTGWGVEVDEGKTNVDTRQAEKVTHIGKERKPSTSQEAAKALLHENGIHVERREQGDRLGDPLLAGLGFKGAQNAEEGLATIMEEVYAGKTREAGTAYYLALGWAKGLDGKPRDFRDVFELGWRRRAIGQYSKNPAEFTYGDIEKAKNSAYTTCVRIFRGTPCDIPGMVYTKDQQYFVGNQSMWEFLTRVAQLPEDERSQTFGRLFRSKFDPTNDRHNRILDKALERAGLES